VRYLANILTRIDLWCKWSIELFAFSYGDFKFEPWELTIFYGQCVCRTMISGTNGLSFKETWFPRTNGPKFPRKHASLGNGPKVMGKPWFCGEMDQVLKELLGANGYLSFLGCNFFSSFHSIYSTYHPYNANVYINFSSILCNIFFNFFIV